MLRGVRDNLARADAAVLAAQVAVSEIPAPTGDEGGRATWIAARFAAMGLVNVHSDAAGNVVGRREGVTDAEPVVVCAHLDTVFPRTTKLQVRRVGGRLVGPGIGDNGRGLAGMLAVASAIDGRRVRTRRSIEFVATTGEEGNGDLRGAKHLFANRRQVHAVIAIDGAGDDRVIHRALGARRFRIAYVGPGGHSWAAYGIANPVHAAATATVRLASAPLPTDPRTTLSVGRIGGGTAINVIPEEGWLEVDLRSTSSAVIERFDRELRLIAAAAADEENSCRARGSPPLSVTVSVIGDRPCGETPLDHPLVRSAFEATQLVGRTPDAATASTDANVPISLGIPAIAIGAGGRGGDAHTTAEWFDNTGGTIGLARGMTIVATAAELVPSE
ncbi:MAG: M20/M25/M40 family metallo-hydrolase [Gemmatimonadaceae bacterium]